MRFSRSPVIADFFASRRRNSNEHSRVDISGRFYAFFITFTTVGFGDLIPGHESGNKAHIAYRVIMIILGLAAMSNVINSIVKCEDSAKLFKKLKERFRRTRNVEVTELNGDGGEEMIEKAPEV